MIDTISHAGAWADAIRNSPTMRVSEYTASPLAELEAELNANLAKRKAIRAGYSLAQGRK
jgi:hypothetical protein